MKEEIKVVEENIGENMVDAVSTENSGKDGFVKAVLIVTGVVGASALAGFIAHKIRDGKGKFEAKRIAKQIKNLEKKGYTVYRLEDVNDFAEDWKSDEQVTEK